MLKEKTSFAYDNKGFMLLYFNRCAKLLIHTRQTQKIKKTFLILHYSTLEGTLVQYNSGTS